MSPALSIVAALALAHQCAPAVAPETVVGVARTESGLHPLAVRDNTADRSYAPASADEAVALATSLINGQRHSVDLGLMQINSANLATFGLSIPDAFDACHSIETGARILSGAFHHALRAALSTYNTGDPQRGIDNGYVASVEATAMTVPAITPGLQAAPTLASSAAQAGGRPTTGWDVFAQSGGTPFVFTSNGAKTHAR
jgi:type IV secretion system protein VirB1